MQETTAVDFYNRIVEGKEYEKKIQLSHGSGATLDGVELHPVDKGTLASVIQSLPEEMFDSMEGADSAEEAEEMLEENDISVDALSSQTVESFETLVQESLQHPELTPSQMDSIVEALDFGLLFELGGEIIDVSYAEGGAIKDFQKQQ
jgi:hypothetical protein